MVFSFSFRSASHLQQPDNRPCYSRYLTYISNRLIESPTVFVSVNGLSSSSTSLVTGVNHLHVLKVIQNQLFLQFFGSRHFRMGEINWWFSHNLRTEFCASGFVCGIVSGALEIIDIACMRIVIARIMNTLAMMDNFMLFVAAELK
ncbi:uncharacterized protein LOC132928547 isoform X5 [Rhopalosiphum padi]|uniref:uncharacterized protein LOC132928547 isoform X5 n=1 Tax=Rhopalosiphum padi TaxID=40932 RepID=UPI00298D6C60|nr:uncharacterized protein LOC132928547 isoform X5 [Rhopalosiphum padi]